MKVRKGLGSNAAGNAPVTVAEEGLEGAAVPSWEPKSGPIVAKVEGHEFGANRRARIVGIDPRLEPAEPEEDDPPSLATEGPEWVKARLFAAGHSLKRDKLPSELMQLAGAIAGGLPAISGDDEDGRREAARIDRPARPSGRLLDELDECLGWLLTLGPDLRTVVFCKMLGYSYRRIAALDPHRRPRSTLHVAFQGACVDIWARLRRPNTRA